GGVQTASASDQSAEAGNRRAAFPGGFPDNNPPVFNPPKKQSVTATLTVSNVPNQLVADFVKSRIKEEADSKDVFRAHATITAGPTHAGKTVTATLEAEEN